MARMALCRVPIEELRQRVTHEARILRAIACRVRRRDWSNWKIKLWHPAKGADVHVQFCDWLVELVPNLDQEALLRGHKIVKCCQTACRYFDQQS